LSWKSIFLRIDSFCKIWEKLPFKPGRTRALKKAEKWILDHQENDGSWGGIMLPYIYSLIALRCLDYPLDHPVVSKGLTQMDGFVIEDNSTMRLQPATSPVWDTAWTLIALTDSGVFPQHSSITAATKWLLDQEIRVHGDWKIKNPTTEPGCWAFEFENDKYPDVDDTAEVVRALFRSKISGEGDQNRIDAIKRGVNWILSMQSKDGGWAAFDQNNNKQFLNHIPFADFMSPLDPTCPDVTAHVVELLSELNLKGDYYQKALEYLKKMQEPDGSWCGRWGVNYLYGTSQAVIALCSSEDIYCRSCIDIAVLWLTSRQNSDGGWGESCLSYEKPLYRGKGHSTASQTAWVLLALIAAGEVLNPATQKGVSYLLNTQLPDGSWYEDAYTGTGFPRAFYLRYDLYRIYFPLMALSRYLDALNNPIHHETGGGNEKASVEKSR
jgi:squalene-hopene/tetraprenyl-beta-curcumene cyclase